MEKKMKYCISVLVILFSISLFAQIRVPAELLNDFETAKQQHNEDAKVIIADKILKYNQIDESSGKPFDPGHVVLKSEPPFNPEWYNSDVQVYTGDVAYSGGFRQLDLKQGEDGWMYLVVARRNIPGYSGGFQIFVSSNGGATWSFIIGLYRGDYVQSVSLLIENRSSNNSIPDSTRMFVYYTYSSSTNFDNAALGCFSSRRNGSAWYSAGAGSPASGNKYEFPSSCSDGMYWSTGTFIHCVVREATNAGANVGLRHFLSINWGVTHSSALINTTYDDRFPSAQYGEKNGSDSVYIAVERRFTSTEYGLRMLATPDIPGVNYASYFLTPSASGVKYEKPELTVVQQHYSIPRKMLITCTRNRNPRYFYTTNGGSNWTIDALLGPNANCVADYTTCNSDSLTSGGQNVIMGYVSDDGDSVNVKQLTVPPGTIYAYYKKNSNTSSGVVAPSTSICRIGSTKYAAFAYAGFGPVNAYYNAEQLVSAVNPLTETADKYELSQNYPNPFNPSTKINFSLPSREFVKISVFDMLGREIRVLVSCELNRGVYSVDFNAAGFSSGAYFYRISAGDFTQVRKMIIVK
jgi:Secretion system C-terminal sorting domain